MYPQPKKIIDLGKGTLSIMGKPSGGEYLADDLRYLGRMGCTSIVSLLEVAEASELGLTNQSSACADLGIHFSNLPIKDRSVPSHNAAFIESIRESYCAILKGARLVVHCRAGIGRSGIYTTAVLIAHGFEVEAAFALVSEARGLTIPDTQLQLDWVYENQGEFRTPLND